MAKREVKQVSRRRSNGQGSIFRTKEGRWRGFVTIGYTPDGAQVKRWCSASTQREAAAKLAALMHLSSARTIEKHETFTVAEWIARFTDLRAQHVRPKTRESHAYYCAKISDALGSKRLRNLTRSHVRRFYLDLLEQGLGISVRRHVHHYLKAAFDEAFQDRLIDRNPALVDVPKGEPTRKGETWTPEQIDTFLEHARSDRLYPLFHVLLFQGVRIGEALGFTWDDYDGERLTVRQTLGIVNNQLVLGPPKNERGHRVFYLLPRTRNVLEHHRQASQSPFIFASETGGLLDPNNARRSYRRLVKGSGLPYIRLHDHRHTFISLARRAGIPSEVVASIVGQDPSVTARIYTHISDDQRREAAQRLAEYLDLSLDLEQAA